MEIEQHKESWTIDNLNGELSGVERNVQFLRQSNDHMQRSPSRNVFRIVNGNSCRPTGNRGSACWRQQVAGYRSLAPTAGRAPVYWEGFR